MVGGYTPGTMVTVTMVSSRGVIIMGMELRRMPMDVSREGSGGTMYFKGDDRSTTHTLLLFSN